MDGKLMMCQKNLKLSFDQAVDLFVERGKKIKKEEAPELIAVYGNPNSGKTFFAKRVMKELFKGDVFVGVVQTSDDPESDLEQFQKKKKVFPNYEFPFIFFHEIYFGGVDLFTLEHFGRFADTNLYIFDPKAGDVDTENIKRAVESEREIWSKEFKKEAPETMITVISNALAKVK